MKLIVIQINDFNISDAEVKQYEEKWKKDIKSGLLVLPCWCTAFVTEDFDNVEVKTENERPQGKWIENHSGVLYWEECDQCHAQVATIGMPFCPNCGADMRGKT